MSVFSACDRSTLELDIRRRRQASQGTRERSLAGGNHRHGQCAGRATASEGRVFTLPTQRSRLRCRPSCPKPYLWKRRKRTRFPLLSDVAVDHGDASRLTWRKPSKRSSTARDRSVTAMLDPFNSRELPAPGLSFRIRPSSMRPGAGFTLSASSLFPKCFNVKFRRCLLHPPDCPVREVGKPRRTMFKNVA